LFKSRFHRDLYPWVPDEKAVIIPNGVDESLYLRTMPRNPFLMINTAYPGRSLSALVHAYEVIKSQVPQASLSWAYGWSTYDRFFGGSLSMAKKKSDLQARMKILGIAELGHVEETALATLYLSAGLYVYPSEAVEVDCISVSKAQIAGAIPIGSEFGVFDEKRRFGGVYVAAKRRRNQIWDPEWGDDDSITDPEQMRAWIDKVCEELVNPRSELERSVMRRVAAAEFNIASVVDRWCDLICSFSS